MNSAQTNRQLAERGLGQSKLRPESLPGLAATLETFAEYLGAEASKLLKSPFTCVVEGVDQGRLIEALEASHGLPKGVLFSPELNAQAYLIFDAQFGWALIDSVFARATGASVDEKRYRPAPTATRVGERFVREMAQAAATALTNAFSMVTSASFELQRVEASSEPPPTKRHDAPMVTARLAVKAFAGEGRIVLLFPQAAIGRLRQDLSEPPKSEESVDDPRWSQELTSAVTSAPIELTAVMEELQMSLKEVANLSVGTVIALRGSGMGRLRLVCNGQDLFRCRMAESSEHYALQIE